jgi:hypothetical protein
MYTLDSYKSQVIEKPNFILNWDNILTSDECNAAIDFFHNMKKLNLVFSRQEIERELAHHKSDNQCFLTEASVLHYKPTGVLLTNILGKIWPCYQEYINKFSILTSDRPKETINSVKIQHTKPGEGYHIWHYDNDGRILSDRYLVFTIYLNTVEEGGETEFLYQSERVNAVEGRVSLFPAGFTHTHRGNPPLSGDKYIITGWIEFAE